MSSSASIMDDIMTFKNKHVNVTDSQMKEILQTKTKLMDIKNEQDHLCDEDEAKIEKLISKITSMKENLQSEKQTLEYKDRELSNRLDKIVQLEGEQNISLKENQSLELQRNKLKICRDNVQDQALLENGRRKYMLYKELTRIRWDFEYLEEKVTGYVSNKKDYIHHFSYKNNITGDLADLLWQEIYKSTVPKENRDVHNEENIQNKST
ncbi:uncharacterized protein LOC122395298 [Colletes gigas]|uniref:uncharacterized protein LOC122395298 n=1 Tax=Colletes gigas TaxID=935657 RepID=UPI001C9A7C08|nr:uncharacterized protein LOC122395298 [Colletes gigas]